ncbi:hypothetical protein [Citricoccus nitrophenolicus]|uniref:hypothetical protein n=1 Tax=Citricoccus nitrophenolicus TaxID=863575 RepID=UPI0031E884C0
MTTETTHESAAYTGYLEAMKAYADSGYTYETYEKATLAASNLMAGTCAHDDAHDDDHEEMDEPLDLSPAEILAIQRTKDAYKALVKDRVAAVKSEAQRGTGLMRGLRNAEDSMLDWEQLEYNLDAYEVGG